MRKLILASKSPRRSEIMEMLPWEFTVDAADIEEQMDASCTLEDNLRELTYQKALPIAERYPDHIVVGADTIVLAEDEILGKPKDEADARRMLHLISHKPHEAYTGVCLLCLETGERIHFCECTRVVMTPMSEAEIDRYIAGGEPFGKAGAYAIQGTGGVFVERIEGDFYNVMGLPLNRLYQELKKWNDRDVSK